MSVFSQPARANWTSRLVGFALLIVGSALVAGLIEFANDLPRGAASTDQETDAIVVLTGGSGRLSEGLQLLVQGKAKKMFISGVYRGVDVAEILDMAQHDPETLTGRIALGHEADDTLGNARETAQWMEAEGFTSLRLVTANYHMPRSLAEFRHAMPKVTLVMHPVSPPNVRLDEWWRWPGTATLVATEYVKFLISVARTEFFG